MSDDYSKEVWRSSILLIANVDTDVERFDELLQQLQHDSDKEESDIMKYKLIKRKDIVDYLDSDYKACTESGASDKAQTINESTMLSQELAIAFRQYVTRNGKAITKALDTVKSSDLSEDDIDLPKTLQVTSTISYLLVDYPSDLTEVLALLRHTESCAEQNNFTNAFPIPLDGIISIVDTHNVSEGKDDAPSSERVAGDGLHPTDNYNEVCRSRQSIVDACWEEMKKKGSEWNDFLISEVALRDGGSKTEYKPVNLVQMEVLELSKTIANDKEIYNAEKMLLSIHSATQFDAARVVSDTKKFHQVLPQSVFENSSLALIVKAMVETIVQTDRNESKNMIRATLNGQIEPFLSYHEGAAVNLLAICGNLDPTSFIQEEESAPSWFDSIREAEKSLWSLCNYPGTGPDGRNRMPKAPVISIAERSASLHELKYISGLSLEHVRLKSWYTMFQDIMKNEIGVPLRTRDHYESLNDSELPQRLAFVLQTSKRVISQYDRLSDCLLMAAIPDFSSGKQYEESWSAADQVQPIPSFAEWKQMQSFSGKSNDDKRPRIPLLSKILHLIKEDRVTIFSSNHALIRLYRTPNSRSWLTVYHESDHFGLRPSRAEKTSSEKPHPTKFMASCADGALFTVQEVLQTKISSVKATYTTRTGIVISISMQGIITQRMLSKSTAEKSRLIRPDGTVLSTHRDGKQVLMYPSGVMYVKDVTSKRFTCIERNNFETSKVDLETGAVVKTKKSGVVAVTHRDNRTIAYHLDGTMISFTPLTSTLVVRKRPWEDVFINVNLSLFETKLSHEKESFPVRCTVVLADLSSIVLGTDVVSDDKRRSITVVKKNGLVMSAQEDGHVCVSYTSEKSAVVSGTGSNSVHKIYRFDCRQGQLLFEDHDKNQMCASLDRFEFKFVAAHEEKRQGYKPEANTRLQAEITERIDPFLFVLHGDGTGLEILRPHDTKKFMADKDFNEMVPGGTENDAQLRTFMRIIRSNSEIDGLDLLGSCMTAYIYGHVDLKYVATAAELLPDLHNCPPPPSQFNIIRQLHRISWLNDIEMQAFANKLNEWRHFKDPKDQTDVLDPRDKKTLEDEARLQKEVIIAYKASSIRRYEERRLEMDSTGELPLYTGSTCALSEQGINSDETEIDDCAKVDEATHIDDFDQLIWESFHRADSEQIGFLSTMQTRAALVHALGFGFSTKEIENHLRQLGSQDTVKVAGREDKANKMGGPPSPKRQKVSTNVENSSEEKELAELQKSIDAAGRIEEELELENENCAEEVLAIENKYNIRRRPFYEKRSKLLNQIPFFWKQTFCNHPILRQLIEETDEKILDSLDNVDIQFVDDKGGYRIEMSFKSNPYFHDQVLWRKISFSEDEEANNKSSGINWKSTAEAKEVKENNSLFQWFNPDEEDADIAEVIKDELWKNPLQFYLDVNTGDDDAQDDDEEEEQEDGIENDDEEEETN
ncbi:unnamed protein product [Albugo candida]|uniref:Uncharacterized protein n=1 Tax=Albugo candida TaxID=65357 RepID=A0A024GJN4_9STRA|nr:unnamed protein product [Albugo candida]|eukprot:CCI46539.1 unnamed protein product [Albugo candida]